VRLLFENPVEDPHNPCKDYEAICWLVDQQYLTADQAAELIEILAKEVLESLLPLQTGNHNLIENDWLKELPRFCALDVRSLVESCQARPTRRPPNNGMTAPSAPIQPLRVPNPLPRQAPPSPMSPPRQAVAPPLPPDNFSRPLERSPQALTKTTYTIACIDDSPTVLSAIETFLDDKAFKVIRIENPVSALMTIIRNKPDLILLDVTMPSLDGYELCSLLRRHPAFKHTPIIMVTGNRGFLDRAKAKLVGASGYLTKPFTQPDLLKIIFKHLT
jgi:twitching motility two-component system response regulator PilG